MTDTQRDIAPEKGENLPIIDPGLTEYAPVPATTEGKKPQTPRQAERTQALVDSSKKTWGEKMFGQFVYGWNMFGSNLVLSAAITYLSKHNIHGQKLYSALQTGYRKIGVKNEYLNTALTNAFTLLGGGHLVALGVVKPAEDRKSPIVQWLDEKYYGKDAEAIPEVKAAHERIDKEMKPTWTGTFIARMGGWSMVQLSALSIGSEEVNAVKYLGKKWNNHTLQGFKGVEGYSRIAGTKIAEVSPGFMARGVNKIFAPFTPKNEQSKAFRRYTEYASMDVMYTAITAVTIKPFNNWLMTHIPYFRTERTATHPSPGFKAINFLDESGKQQERKQEGDIQIKDAPALAPDTLPALESKQPTAHVSQVEREGPMAEQQREKA